MKPLLYGNSNASSPDPNGGTRQRQQALRCRIRGVDHRTVEEDE